jgi:hypothetical protein
MKPIINGGGGPAFPVLSYEYKATGDLHPSPTVQPGMSFRDWLAGMALQGMLAGSAPEGSWPEPEHLAAKCCEYADAVISELG